MAKSKPSPKTISRIFERTTAPAYVVGTDHVISYANEACAKWVGIPIETLIASTCVYTSQDLNDETKNKVQGLCPPPQLLSAAPEPSKTQTVFVASTDKHGTKKSWRNATASLFFNGDGNLLGVLVICEDTELSAPPTPPTSSASLAPHQLHSTLASIRRETDRIYTLESLVGISPFANRLRRQVSTAIGCNSDLLIHGPAGSGKEHLSRTIHSARDRTDSSELLPVHCSIADQRLIQQNIKDIVDCRTGSHSGSITTTDSQEPDWLLLLDVDSLGDGAQVELLGFFQLPNFPLRTIATASSSLIELANRGEFSIELAHHLSTMTIDLVPLKKRQDDIPLLAQALIERDNPWRERQLSGCSDQVMQKFIEFDWPENIDQLNRIIQDAARNTSGSEIQVSDLPQEFLDTIDAMRIGRRSETVIQLDQYLNEIEQELVARALKQAKGNKTKASKLLGISRAKLLRRIQFFGLDRTDTPDPSDPDQLDSSAFKELE